MVFSQLTETKMLDNLIGKIAEEFTLQYGILGLILVLLSYVVYMLTMRILGDKDKQIEHLADENREYRERFTNLLDKQFNFGAKEKAE